MDAVKEKVKQEYIRPFFGEANKSSQHLLTSSANATDPSTLQHNTISSPLPCCLVSTDDRCDDETFTVRMYNQAVYKLAGVPTQ